SEKPYGDFRLRLEFNMAKGSDSGVVVRALLGERTRPHFKLCERPGVEQTGTSNWILNTSKVAPGRSAEMKPAGSWNRLELEVQGNSMRAWVNGQEVSNVTLAANAFLPDGNLPGLSRSRGRIGLQRRNGVVRFRNLEIKELPGGSGGAAGDP